MRWALLTGILCFVGCVGDQPTIPNDGGGNDASTTPDVVTSDSPADVNSCDATMCSASCVDLQTDDTNCGACGHSCNGDGCVKGACKQVDLLTGLDFPTTLALSPAFPVVFVNASSRVVTCSKTGCGNSPAQMWTGSTYTTHQTSPLGATKFSMVTQVFNTSNAQAWGHLAGGTTNATDPSVATTIQGQIAGLAAFPDDNTAVYFWNYGVYKCDANNCATGQSTAIDGDNGETAVAVVGGTPGYIAWTTFNNIRYCARTSCTNTSSGQNLFTSNTTNQVMYKFMALTATAVYWVEPASGNLFQIRSCPFPGGCAPEGKLLVDGEAAVDGFAADDKGIYWTQSTAGNVRGCLDTQNGCGTSAVNIATNQAHPTGIVMDGTEVFWSQTGGSAGQGKVTRMVR